MLIRYKVVTARSDIAEETLGLVCIRWSGSYGMYHRACKRELEGDNLAEWNKIESLPSRAGGVRLEMCYSAVNNFRRKLPRSHHRFCVNWFYIGGRDEIGFKSVDCVE